ncbi:hypothetical protein DV515_00011037 [Chloebia gouldiae]|uniref:Uncharacterized protein n=1 Tax=Chloebia gouldiae TaxID=44316 RepID=A0A3L8S8E9_CHLGU|nr:hypothetical protein DV515_00011037 [Chloebia gouldiae]
MYKAAVVIRRFVALKVRIPLVQFVNDPVCGDDAAVPEGTPSCAREIRHYLANTGKYRKCGWVFCCYLAEQCWNGGFVYLIMLRRIKRKAPLPPSNGNNSNSCDPKAKPSPEPGDRASQNGKRTRKFGVITRTPGGKDSKDKLGSEHGNGHCTPMEVEVAQPETSEAESNGEEQHQSTGAPYQGQLSDDGMPDIGDQAAQLGKADSHSTAVLPISVGKCQHYLDFWLVENVPYLAKQKRKANSVLQESKHEA